MILSIEDFLTRSPATSKEIQVATGLSQTAVSRRLRDMESRIVPIKSGRSVRYAITQSALGGDDSLPLFMVDAHGNNTAIANIRPLAHGGFYVEPRTGYPAVIMGHDGSGVFDGLPYFLDDLRPQGFLGRQIAAELSGQSDRFPSDPRHWNTDHVGRYLISNGDDLPGNLKFGEQAHLRMRRKPVSSSTDDYPSLANDVMNGVLPGSSAGGEQPKFTAFCGEMTAHVIVKFSPRGDSDIARRWKDILITEYHAAETLHRWNSPAAEVRLIEADDRVFLEALRFDRRGEYGRLPMTSLQAVDYEFVGDGSSWINVVNELQKKELFSPNYVVDTEMLWAFGKLINNTDMHLGNLSLAMDGGVFKLLPVYDMCSMGFAPKSGEVVPYSFIPVEVRGSNLGDKMQLQISDMARTFWDALSQDARISNELKAFLAEGNPIDRLTRPDSKLT
jgi:hypothetical protein